MLSERIMRSSYWQPWRCTPRRHTDWVSRQYVPLSRTSPKTYRTDSVISIMNPLQTYLYRVMLFYLPSLVSIHEWWCLSSNVGACADQKQHNKQKTLEVENGRLKNVNYTWCLDEIWFVACFVECLTLNHLPSWQGRQRSNSKGHAVVELLWFLTNALTIFFFFLSLIFEILLYTVAIQGDDRLYGWEWHIHILNTISSAYTNSSLATPWVAETKMCESDSFL